MALKNRSIPADWSPLKRMIYMRGDPAIGGGGLPPAYRQVEYLETNGGQYIDSGIECTSDLAVEFRSMVTSNTTGHICGGIDMSNAPVYFRHHYSPTNNSLKYWVQHDAADGSSTDVLFPDNNHVINVEYTIAIDPVNGTARFETPDNLYQKTFTPLQNDLTTGKNYGIMGRIANNGSSNSRPNRCYYFKFFRNGAMIGNFIPCVRRSDGEIGMYDTVTKTFFTNAGTGKFIIPDNA